MMTVRIWLNIQFPVAPFITESTVEQCVKTRKEAVDLLAGEIVNVRKDAERVEVRCIFW